MADLGLIDVIEFIDKTAANSRSVYTRIAAHHGSVRATNIDQAAHVVDIGGSFPAEL